MTDEEFKEFIEEVNEEEHPVYVLGYCCSAIDEASGGEDMSYRSICPCPVMTQFCVSESKPKFLSGVSDGRLYYGEVEYSGYTVGQPIGPDYDSSGGRGWGSSVTASDGGLKRTISSNCNFERDADGVRKSPLQGGTSESYSGGVIVSGTHTYCEDLAEEYEYDGSLDEVYHYDVNGTLPWNGGTPSAVIGLFQFWDFVTDGCSNSPSEYSYTNTDTPDGGFTFSVSATVGSPSTSTYSGCPTWCDAEDSEGNTVEPIKGNECITFEPCGACAGGTGSNSVDFTSVKFCFIVTNVRCGEYYSGCYQQQKRSYVAFCGTEPEDDWFLDEVKDFSFVGQDIFHIVGGNLRVLPEHFIDADYSTSIYDYRDYFFEGYDDEGEEVWDTDADVITPTLSLPKEQGEQYRVKPNALNIWITGDGNCPTDLTDEDFVCPADQ